MSISTVIKSVQDIMRKDTGVDGDAQRISQMVWLIFLKIFDAKEAEWELLADSYTPVVPEGLRWRDWALNDEGKTGDSLSNFINNELFPKLKGLHIDASGDMRKFIVKSVFEDSYNYMKSGTLLRDVINKLNEIDFNKQQERHLFNDIYEKILKDLQSAGNAGEYYTPRGVTQFVVDMVNPRLGETILDPACGTGGFLVCALGHLEEQVQSLDDRELLKKALRGIEKKPLPHMLAMTNLILHDIDNPGIKHSNALNTDIMDLSPQQMVDVVVTNPPFGGEEEDGINMHFPGKFKTKETADLFLTMIIYLLNDKGRCGIVLPDGFLFGEGVKTAIKEKLFTECNLHTIVRLPNGVFSPYTDINTNLLFFEKGGNTKEIWYYELPLPEGYKKFTKTKPIESKHFDQVRSWWTGREENEFAWKVSAEELKKKNYNLDVKNPTQEAEEHKAPEEIYGDYEKSRQEAQALRDLIKNELQEALAGGK